MSSPIRQAFITRLRNRFFDRLRNEPVLSEWGMREVYQLSLSIIQRKLPQINQYLDKEKIPVTEADKIIDLIIRDFLLPELKDLTL
jgi:hypothetical protein